MFLLRTSTGLLDEWMFNSLYLFSYLYLPPHVDVVIGFTQTKYVVTEGVDSEAPLVVGVIMGTLRRSVIVNVNTRGGTAVGEDKSKGVDPPTHTPTHTHTHTHSHTHTHTHKHIHPPPPHTHTCRWIRLH